MSRVRFEHVTRRYDDAVALDNFSLDVDEGEFLVLVGPSGCGKTTALRCLSGLDEPDDGSVYIGDVNVTFLEPAKRDVAMVFQNYALYPYLSVFDNLAFPLKMRKVRKNERRPRVEAVAEMLGIGELLNRKPGELSGGQRQRVALGRAIVRDPAVFLMDEPLSNLDAQLRGQTRTELIRLQRELGTTTIYVTHDQVEAMTMGHRLAVLNDGRLQQVGIPTEIYTQPANRFVASFIGNPPMNQLPARVERQQRKLITDHGQIQISQKLADRIASRDTVIVGFRPEHVAVENDLDRGAGSSKLTIEIDVVEALGSDTFVTGSNGIRVRLPVEQPYRPGQEVHLRIDVGHLHLFDAQTGVRLTGSNQES